MDKGYPDLISLITHDGEAMEYFKSLPPSVKCQMSRHITDIHTLENLMKYAKSIAHGGN